MTVGNLSPVLTPDWECHTEAWMSSWSSPDEPSVGERTLASGVTAVVFTVTRAVSVPSQGIDTTIERHHGYDKVTGRVVIQELRTNRLTEAFSLWTCDRNWSRTDSGLPLTPANGSHTSYPA